MLEEQYGLGRSRHSYEFLLCLKLLYLSWLDCSSIGIESLELTPITMQGLGVEPGEQGTL
jgi:hypothetical protein